MPGGLRGYLGLGSNLGDRHAKLLAALTQLAELPGLTLLRASGVYESPAWGYASSNPYYNAVVEITWSGEPLDLLAACQRTEVALGRQRTRFTGRNGYMDRPIDIDILWLQGIELQGEILTLPHLLASRRAFVLLPWSELTPGFTLHGRGLDWWIALLPEDDLANTKRVAELSLPAK